jgi:predicted nuclease of restriction endonuclease-like (RecB) superfamily
MNQEILPSAYAELLEELKQRIRTARIRAALSVNRGLIRLYWEIGKAILERQKEQGWGAKVVSRLADDLRREFPDMQGLSRANLSYMRAFAEAYPDEQFVQQVVGQLPWGHNIIIFTKLKDPALREWYIIPLWMTSCATPRITHPSAFCSAKARTKWWWSMPFATSISRWVWQNTALGRRCRSICAQLFPRWSS